MRSKAAVFEALLQACAPVFTKPSFPVFVELCVAWMLCPSRRTVTGMLGVLGSPLRRAHDSYHRFLREGRWEFDDLWRILIQRFLSALLPKGPIRLAVDDTLFHKSGRKVEGAGVFRDAVRSTTRRVVHALGLNLVVVTLQFRPPWGGEPLGLPVLVRLHRKEGPTLLDLATQMLLQLAQWLPGQKWTVCGDGFYASLAGRDFPNMDIVSRMRRDAALFLRPQRRHKGQRGRPRKKGARLPALAKLAAQQSGWKRVEVDVRGHKTLLLLKSLPVLWYGVRKDAQVLLVIVRDPKGRQPDDFFFTTDLAAAPDAVAADYSARWAIEDTFRNVKQCLGGQEPQCWKRKGPERAAAFSFWLYSATWWWYICVMGTKRSWIPSPWYSHKSRPSFLDALASLRASLWTQRINHGSGSNAVLQKTIKTLIDTLAKAA